MRRTNGYTNGVLTVIAAALALNVAVNLGSTGALTAAAEAQPQTGPLTGLINPEEQRNVIIAELRRLGTRLERIEAKLNAGLSVKVTEMPAVKREQDNPGN